jgi:uncharacterized protein (DUF1499 family)
MFPIINDITTSPDRPLEYHVLKKVEANRGRDMSYPSEFSSKQRKAYPDIAPLALLADWDKSYTWVKELARGMPRWTIVDENAKSRRIEAVATTEILHFKDDVVIEVHGNSLWSTVHMRSKSRMGKGDLGTNAQRIKIFQQRLRAYFASKMAAP